VGRNRGRFADRPRNVELSTKAGTTYFYYVFPDGRRATLGKDRPDAYAKAEALNAHFASRGLDLAQLLRTRQPRVSADNPSLPDLVELYRQHLTTKRYSDRTRAELGYKLAAYARMWSSLTVQQLTTKLIADFLDPLTPASYTKHRKLLEDLMQYAAHRGYTRENPVRNIMTRTEAPKVRTRHNLDDVLRIHQSAPAWLQRAIDLGLYSLQRGDDLVSLRIDQVDQEQGTVTVLQRKTRNYRNPVHLEIEMSQQLAAVVGACLADSVPGPFLLRARPRRMTRQAREGKSHPFAITRDTLTRAFSDLRDQVGAYAHLPKEQRPTFHELRALGIHLYTEAGYPKEYVMALSGHATDAMFERYSRDHETKKPRRVAAGLDLDSRKTPGKYPEPKLPIPSN